MRSALLLCVLCLDLILGAQKSASGLQEKCLILLAKLLENLGELLFVGRCIKHFTDTVHQPLFGNAEGRAQKANVPLRKRAVAVFDHGIRRLRDTQLLREIHLREFQRLSHSLQSLLHDE